MYSAIRDPLLMKEYNLIKAVGLAIGVEMIGFGIMQAAGVKLPAKPLAFGAQIFGGILFGLGMIGAAGCASGTSYRVGEGMLGSLVALIGLITGVYMVKEGILKDAASAMTDKVTINGATPTLGGDFRYIVMFIVGGLIIAMFIWKVVLPKRKEKTENAEKINLGEAIFKKPWPWAIAGIAIGVVNIIAYVSNRFASSQGVGNYDSLVGLHGGSH
jgi:hypothetical protein